MCKGSCRRKPTEGLFFLNTPTAARFPNPSRRRLQACSAYLQIPSTTSWSPSPYTGEAKPLSATPASMLRILANPLCKGSSAAGGEGLFFYNPPTAARFPNPSRRRLYNQSAAPPHRFSSIFSIISSLQKTPPLARGNFSYYFCINRGFCLA